MSSDNSSSSTGLAFITYPLWALFSTAKFLSSTVLTTSQYSYRAYQGSPITLSPNFACLRTGSRDKFILVQSSIEFPIYHRAGHGLPPDFKVYRMRKGWRAGFLGWDAASWTGGLKKGSWEDVTPLVELKSATQGNRLVYTDSAAQTQVRPSRSFVKEAYSADLTQLAAQEDPSIDVSQFTSVTHLSIHQPLTTQDGFYRFVITDANAKILIVSPEYALHASFTSFGILRGSSIPALPIQLLGFIAKKAVAGVTSPILTAMYWSGAAPTGLAVKLFRWYFAQQIQDATDQAWKMAREKGAIKPLDYLAKGLGGALPGTHGRMIEYEREWDGAGSWVVRNLTREMLR